eukprot:2509468-Lingulodinium_polyedra.AAC.1
MVRGERPGLRRFGPPPLPRWIQGGRQTAWSPGGAAHAGPHHSEALRSAGSASLLGRSRDNTGRSGKGHLHGP